MTPEYDILLVEDEHVVINSAIRILSSEGISVDSCTDASAALSKISESNYKIIVSDLMLPGLSGLQFLQEVKQLYPGQNVVIISGYATRDSFLDSYTFGAFDFIPKPFEFEELLGTVQRCIRYSNLHSSTGLTQKTDNFKTELCHPDKQYHLGEHTWVCVDGEDALVGLGRSITVLQGDIDQIEFPGNNQLINQGDLLLKIIDSHDYVHRVCTPVSGRILGINEQIALKDGADIELSRHWFIRLKPNNLETELKALRHK